MPEKEVDPMFEGKPVHVENQENYDEEDEENQLSIENEDLLEDIVAGEGDPEKKGGRRKLSATAFTKNPIQPNRETSSTININLPSSAAAREDTEDKTKQRRIPLTINNPDDFSLAMDTAIGGLSGEEHYMQVYRITPKTLKGKQISGYIGRFPAPGLSLQDIEERWGGGIFRIKIFRVYQDSKTGIARSQIRFNREVEIAGDPKPMSEPDKEKEKESSPIVERVLDYSKGVMDSIQKDKADAIKKADQAMLTLFEKKPDTSLKEIVSLVEGIMSHQLKTSELQIEAAREDAKRAREEAKEFQQNMWIQMNELKKDAESRTSSSVAPVLEFLKMQASEAQRRDSDTQKRMELQMMAQKDMSDMMLKMMMANSENQMKLSVESSKTQVDILTKELSRISDELKDARSKQSNDLLSKLKEFKLLKGLMAEEGTAEPPSIADRIMDNLPEIASSLPAVMSSVGSLFGKGQQVMPPPQALPNPVPPPSLEKGPMLPEPRPPESAQPPGAPAQAQPQEAELTPEQQQAVAANIVKFLTEAQESIRTNVKPAEFFSTKVDGKYDNSFLKQIGSYPSNFVISVLTKGIQDETSPLLTVAGKDFLRRVHGLVKQKYA